MRLSKADLPGRVNSNLRLRFQAKALTSFAGLELVRRYFGSIDLGARIRRHLKDSGLDGDYGVVAMVVVVLGLLICGGRRLQHLLYLKDDPLMLRLAGLRRLPTPRTLGAARKNYPRFRESSVRERVLCQPGSPHPRRTGGPSLPRKRFNNRHDD